MMKNKLIIAAAVVIVGIAGFAVSSMLRAEDSGHHSGGHSDSPKPAAAESKKPAETQATNQVSYKGFDVSPKSIKVKKGTTVTWTNEDATMHDVKPDTETADFKASKLFGKGETHSVTFNEVGTYTYHCSPHPYMKGSIEVVES